MKSLLRPRSIAIVGASDTSRGGWAQRIYENFEHTAPDTKLFLVNPNRAEVWGRQVYPSFEAIGEPVDLALCIIPSKSVVDTLAEGAANGLRCALVYAAQFGEGGDPEGLERARALLSLRDTHGMRISGPNCMGLLSLRERLLLYPAPRVRTLSAGSVGIVFQSGGTFQFWLQQAAVRGLGFSYAVSSGNELDFSMADYLDFMVEDENTRVIACLAEGIRKPEAFMAAAAKALKAGKPVVMVKSGRSRRGQAAALSHTGALAGDDQVFNAMCHAYGITRCDTLDDMIETCLAFQAGRLPDRPGAAVVTVSGSAKGMMLDYAEDAGLDLVALSQDTADKVRPLLDPGVPSENPLDIGATAASAPQRFSKICQIVAEDDQLGSLLIQGSVPIVASDNADPSSFAELAKATDKVILAWSRTAQNMSEDARRFQVEAGIPFLQGMPQAVRALVSLVRFAETRARGVKPLPPLPDRASVSPGVMNDLIAARGIPLPRSAFVATAADAAQAAGRIGFPVVIKIVSPDALHKTEVGGVAIGLGDAITVAEAADGIAARLKASNPDARVDGFLVQEMVNGGLELMIGARSDPIYGPMLMVGLGGIHTEALRDTAIRLLPVDADDARAMLGGLRAKALLGPYRGKPAPDVEAVVIAMVSLGEIFLEHRNWLGDIEINPLMVLANGRGVRAVDVRIIEKEGRSASPPAN